MATVLPNSNNSDSKKVQVEGMFDSIATHYDLLNHTLSLNVDKIWRRKVVKIVGKYSPTRVLDVATGTADLAIALTKTQAKQIVGIDLSENMLAIGREKVAKRGLQNIINLQKGDAENLPFADGEFDATTVSFGARNFENLEAGLKQMHRILAKNGICVVLEFTMPRRFPIKQLYKFYFRCILPVIGRMVSNDDRAYTYLPESVQAFPQYDNFTDIMLRCGFSNVTYKVLSMGIAAIYIGRK